MEFSLTRLATFAAIFALIGGYFIFHIFAAPNPNLSGDLNNDNKVDSADLAILNSSYGSTSTSADINKDGKVSVLDLSALMANWGRSLGGSQTYPNAPTDLHITDSAQQTSLTAAWTAVKGASGYRIGQNGASLHDTSNTSYTWPDLTCGTSYTLSVQPETSTSDTSGQIAVVSGATAACSSGGGGGGSSGSVTFQGDWEGGPNCWWPNPNPCSNAANTKWNGAQCANTGVPSQPPGVRGTLNIVTDIVAKGNYAARIDLPANTGGIGACEALRPRTLELSDQWYSYEFRLPTNVWQVNSGRLDLAQLNFENIWGPPIDIDAFGPDKAIRIMGQAGLCRPANTPYPPGPGCAWSSGVGGTEAPMYAIPADKLTLGVWHQLLIHVKWTIGNDGIIQTFYRTRGNTTWNQTVNWNGKPTVQWTATSGTPNAAWGTNDKFGAYRGAESQPVSIWNDNICVATTRAAAETCF